MRKLKKVENLTAFYKAERVLQTSMLLIFFEGFGTKGYKLEHVSRCLGGRAIEFVYPKKKKEAKRKVKRTGSFKEGKRFEIWGSLRVNVL